MSTRGEAAFRKVVDLGRLCCYCAAPATMSTSVRLTDDMPGVTGDDLMADLVAARPLREPSRGVIRVVIDACDDHDDATWWAAEDSGLPIDAGRESLTESTCPDIWHTDDDAYEASATQMAEVAGGWAESHYRCPICGFRTGGVTSAPASVTDDPAYGFVAEVLRRVASAGR